MGHRLQFKGPPGKQAHRKKSCQFHNIDLASNGKNVKTLLQEAKQHPCLKDLSNGFNGELSAGLSGKGDTGLKESEKLALIPARLCQTELSRADSVSNWDICVDDVNASRVLVAMAHAAHVARTLGLDGQPCNHAGGPELAKAIEVSAAYTVVWAGLTGYFQANPMFVKAEGVGKVKYTYKDTVAYVPKKDHISEFDTADPLFPISANSYVVAAHDEPAQSSKDMTGAEADACMKAAVDALGGGKDNGCPVTVHLNRRHRC